MKTILLDNDNTNEFGAYAEWDHENETLYIKLSFFEAVILDKNETKCLVKLINNIEGVA
jgi:hypothetical protein